MLLGPHLGSSRLKWSQSQGLHGVFVKRSLSMETEPPKTREQHFRGGHRASLPMQGGAAGGPAGSPDGRRQEAGWPRRPLATSGPSWQASAAVGRKTLIFSRHLQLSMYTVVLFSDNCP